MFRGKDTSDAGTGVFRRDAGLFLLMTRLRWEPMAIHAFLESRSLEENLPAKNGFQDRSRLGRRAEHWNQPIQLLEALSAISRVQTESGPLQSYLMLSELDARRPPERRLRPETVAMLAAKFSDFGDQYLIFSEFPDLNDASIVAFLQTVTSLNSISKNVLRGNALGTFQASTGLWQIFARQGEIPPAALNDSWQSWSSPLAKSVRHRSFSMLAAPP